MALTGSRSFTQLCGVGLRRGAAPDAHFRALHAWGASEPDSMGRMRTFTVALCLQEDAASESIRLLTLSSQTLFLFLGGLPKLVGFGLIWHLKLE